MPSPEDWADNSKVKTIKIHQLVGLGREGSHPPWFRVLAGHAEPRLSNQNILKHPYLYTRENSWYFGKESVCSLRGEGGG